MPERLTLSKKGTLPTDAVVVAIPPGRRATWWTSRPWASPYVAGEPPPRWPGKRFDAADAVACYRFMLAGGYLLRRPPGFYIVRRAVAELAGRDLVCTCRRGQPCHADVLLEYANADEADLAAIVPIDPARLRLPEVTATPD